VFLSGAYGRLVVVEQFPGGAPKNQTQLPDGERVRLRGGVTGQCGAQRDDLPWVSTSIALGPQAAGKVALRAAGTLVDFHSITVFEKLSAQ
jgi:hypothetical protein